MENLSHSRHPSRSSLPNKACNGSGGFSYGSGKTATNATTTYDDVFGGPPRFGAPTLSPRLEDYCEIFSGLNGSSRAAVSSIPVLDLPVMDDRDVYFDVRSQEFDYREVFGGFNDLDLAPSYEELVMERSAVGDGDSSDDAWTPEEVESISGGTEQSGKSPCYSNGRDSYESIDGSTEFNISYNKASQISNRSISSGMIHVADLSAIPGYTFAVDEIDYAKGASKIHKETRPSFVHKGTSRYAFEEQDSRAVRFPGEPFVTVSEIDLKTHPSRIPPPSRPPPILKNDFRYSASNSRTTGSVGSGDSNSPPFFDVEVDSSSAAVKEAMIKAAAKLKSAKELERQSNEAWTGMKPSSTNNRMEEGKTSHASGLPDIEKNIDLARMGDKHGSKSFSPQGYTNCDGNDEWKEATQFVELVREVPRNSEENSSEKDVSLPLNTDFFNQEPKWTANVDWEKQERRAKGAREDREAKKLSKSTGRKKVSSRHQRHEKNMLAEKVSEEQQDEKAGYVALHFETGSKSPDDGGILKHRDLFRQEENNFLTEKVPKQQEEEKTKRIQNHQFDKTPHPWKAAEKNQESVFDWEHNARKLREALGLAENESTLEVSLELKGNGKSLGMDKNEKKLNEALKRVEEETRIKDARVTEENDRKQREAFEKAENEKRLKAALEQEENEKRVKEAREKEENERKVKEALEKAERERKMKEEEELELRLKEAFEKEEMKRRMREIREKEEHERKMKVAFEQEKERRIKEAREKKENERRIKEAREKAELEQRLKEKLQEEEKERRIKEFQEREDNERKAKEILEQAENQRRLKEAIGQKEKERKVKEETEKKLKEAIELEEKEKRLAEAFERAEIERRLKEDLEQEDMEMRRREAEEREERERMCREYQANEVKQHDFTREEKDERPSDVSEMETECLSDPLEENGREYNHEPVNKVLEDGLGQKESRDMSDEACPWKDFEKNLKDASLKEGTIELDANDEATQLGENGGYNQLNGESGTESAPVSEKIPGGKLEQKGKNFESTKETSVTGVEQRSRGAVVEEDNVRKTSIVRDQRNLEESKFTPKTFSGLRNHENKQDRGNTYDAQDAKFERQLPPRGVRNVNDVSLQREKEAERIKKERDSELERLRKIEEEREREREREKDRMAFDQRALADARERLEKACAEAREKSLPDKSSMEARLRAERAAVERATTEARERAVEKAAFEARERMERSVSDKQFQSSGFFGERMERSVSDKQFQTSRYQTGGDAESPQRYTSRLERHRRTADRVAKALAEKNMRDLVAQREQTERTRISETLDADVKRWSNGKEGNIRALLSTLQYILGTESGWQPIPLTEVITSAAVKRAYRKATLCVHPDKLQQRSATIQQKYICEKVFDLLKEAWNRFNSEER